MCSPEGIPSAQNTQRCATTWNICTEVSSNALEHVCIFYPWHYMINNCLTMKTKNDIQYNPLQRQWFRQIYIEEWLQGLAFGFVQFPWMWPVNLPNRKKIKCLNIPYWHFDLVNACRAWSRNTIQPGHCAWETHTGCVYQSHIMQQLHEMSPHKTPAWH